MGHINGSYDSYRGVILKGLSRVVQAQNILFWNQMIVAPDNPENRRIQERFLKAFGTEEIHSIKHNAVDCITTVYKNNNPIDNNSP